MQTTGNRNRVVVIVGPDIVQKHTCAVLIDRGVHVVGVCMVGRRLAGIPVGFLLTSLRRKGVFRTMSQIFGRLLYVMLNAKEDRRLFNELYKCEWIKKTIAAYSGPLHHSARVNCPKTILWLRSLEPDILVVHSNQFIDETLRSIPRKGLTIGGHPGLTPHYRGSHSAFWAVYQGRPEDIACSVFWMDGGYDTGDIICQEKIQPAAGDSYMSVAWKGMIRQAEIQAEVVLAHDAGEVVPRIPHKVIPKGSYYDIPTLMDYLRYRLRQNIMR